ncbi:MAG: T9SS type A sorting domain-containing protein [Winogradskyella sp.]|uniref:T9SS type A sorting domain-containing protein n=1 Tax=Winogradskyella sp. TaxID=1883156 RepID=UPI0025FF3616|nr:T9SS type A sorting domain-containing protein [Winogradskyella sp.]NRB59313.1 T9SS type A sorting domain-containing protein [Winogradskyella sp.]
MKIRLLAILLISLYSSLLYSQVTVGQVDDFEDGTKQGWFENGSPTETVENAPDDEQAGTTGNYLRDFTTGAGAGAGSRMIIRNTTSWVGDWNSTNPTSQNIDNIALKVRALNSNITVRLSITGPGGKFSTTAGYLVEAGSGWSDLNINVNSADWTSVSDGLDGGNAGTDINATLANVTEMRIISNNNPAWRGQVTSAEMHIDNITAQALLSNNDFEQNTKDFEISPNPGKNSLNIELPNINNNIKLEVFDVLGKRVYHGKITQLRKTVNISNWKSGVYLVRVSGNDFLQTKRFIKQ